MDIQVSVFVDGFPFKMLFQMNVDETKIILSEELLWKFTVTFLEQV